MTLCELRLPAGSLFFVKKINLCDFMLDKITHMGYNNNRKGEVKTSGRKEVPP